MSTGPTIRTCWRWVHVAEVDSFMRCHQRYGEKPLADYDEYVADMAVIATAMGVLDPPETVKELDSRLDGYRNELKGTPRPAKPRGSCCSRRRCRCWCVGRTRFSSAAAVATLPVWARMPLRLPYLPIAEATGVRFAGHALMRGLRWVTG